MNVDVLNCSGIETAAQSRLAIADCDVHPRPPGAAIGGVSKALYPYLSQRWREHIETIGVRYRQPWEKGSAFPKGQPQACAAMRGRTAIIPAAISRSWPSSISTRTTSHSAFSIR